MERDHLGRAQGQSGGDVVQVGSIVEYRDDHLLAMAATVFGRRDVPKMRFELDEIDPLRIREDGNGTVGQNDVGDSRPLAIAYRRGPTSGRGLGGKVGQERAVAERLEQRRDNWKLNRLNTIEGSLATSSPRKRQDMIPRLPRRF